MRYHATLNLEFEAIDQDDAESFAAICGAYVKSCVAPNRKLEYEPDDVEEAV